MDTSETTPVTPFDAEYTKRDFGKDVGQAFVINTAASAGVMAGFAAFVLGASKVLDIWEKRKSSKDQTEPSSD